MLTTNYAKYVLTTKKASKIKSEIRPFRHDHPHNDCLNLNGTTTLLDKVKIAEMVESGNVFNTREVSKDIFSAINGAIFCCYTGMFASFFSQ